MQRLTIHLNRVKPVKEERKVTVRSGDGFYHEFQTKSIIKNTIAVEVSCEDDVNSALAEHADNVKKYYLSNIK